MRPLRFIPVASGLGAPAWAEAACARAPAALAAAGLFQVPSGFGMEVRQNPPLHPPAGPRREALAALCLTLEEKVAASLAAGELPVVVGGDHAIAAGTWRGVALGLGAPPGLLWIDAHLDAHRPEDSPSGNWHGMPLAALLGSGHPDFVLLPGPQLRAENLSILGARSFEPAEVAFLHKMGVRVHLMAEIHRRGLPEVMVEALRRANTGTPGFGLTLDLDVLDPKDATGVSTPARHGLHPRQLGQVLTGLLHDPRCRALEIVEYNPERDHAGHTARLAVQLMQALLQRTPN